MNSVCTADIIYLPDTVPYDFKVVDLEVKDKKMVHIPSVLFSVARDFVNMPECRGRILFKEIETFMVYSSSALIQLLFFHAFRAFILDREFYKNNTEYLEIWNDKGEVHFMARGGRRDLSPVQWSN